MTTTAIASGIVPTWDLADRMTKALRVSGQSVSGMASELGVTRETVGRWINGRNKPTRATVMAWANITGVDLEWLETGTATPEGGRSDVVRHQGLEPRTRWFGGFAGDLRKLFGLAACWCPGDGRHHPSCPDRVTRADVELVA